MVKHENDKADVEVKDAKVKADAPVTEAKVESDEKLRAKERKAELAEREELVKEGKRVFREDPTGTFDFEPVFAQHEVAPAVDVRAKQHGTDVE